MKKKKFKT